MYVHMCASFRRRLIQKHNFGGHWTGMIIKTINKITRVRMGRESEVES